MTECALNPPPPDGFKIWRGAPPPRALTQWAIDLRDNWMPKAKYGDTIGIDYDGKYVVARKDHHTWTYKNGVLLRGICIPGITLYQSLLTPALSGPPGIARGIGATSETDSLAVPDPNVAAYTEEPGTDWTLVGMSAGAAALVVVAFWAGIHYAGRVDRRR